MEEPVEPAAIDTVRGPITGSTRLIGMGGAFVAIAEDTEGVAINPASVAVRVPHSWTPWSFGFGVDIAIGAILPQDESNSSASETQEIEQNAAFFGSVAALLNYRHAGFGISAEAQRNAATRQDRAQGITPTDLAADFGIVHTNAGYGFLQGQLLLGLGARIIGVSFDRHSGGSGLSNAGLGLELGVMIKPLFSQFRLAAAFRSSIEASLPAAPGEPDSTMHVPWEAALGFAYQFGQRPLNPPFTTARDHARRLAPERKPTEDELKRAKRDLFENYQRVQRRYVLISGELAMLEGGGDRVSIGQYWGDSDEQTSSRPVLSPRLGVESEVVAHVLRLRAGSYYEPSRTADSEDRLHGTAGLDVRLFRWNVFGLADPFDYWRLSLAADAAREYLSTAFSIGFWH